MADRASFHQADPDARLQLVHLPTACLDLNPVERFFKEVRQELSNRVFGSLSEAYGAVEWIVNQFN